MKARDFFRAAYRKGNRLIFLYLGVDEGGNTSELADGSGESGKSYLFFLTACSPGIGLPGDRVTWLVKHLTS